MSPLEILTKAQELIRDPEHWTKGVSARNRSGQKTSCQAEDAVCFCSYGAVSRAAPSEPLGPTMEFLDAASGIDSFVGFNDSRTHTEVMEMFDKAKELARAAAA